MDFAYLLVCVQVSRPSFREEDGCLRSFEFVLSLSRALIKTKNQLLASSRRLDVDQSGYLVVGQSLSVGFKEKTMKHRRNSRVFAID